MSSFHGFDLSLASIISLIQTALHRSSISLHQFTSFQPDFLSHNTGTSCNFVPMLSSPTHSDSNWTSLCSHLGGFCSWAWHPLAEVGQAAAAWGALWWRRSWLKRTLPGPDRSSGLYHIAARLVITCRRAPAWPAGDTGWARRRCPPGTHSAGRTASGSPGMRCSC